jgi:hypothetical protein
MLKGNVKVVVGRAQLAGASFQFHDLQKGL